MSRKKTKAANLPEALKKRGFPIFFGASIAIICLGILWFNGRVNTLSCRRVEPTQIDCLVQTQWLGLIPLQTQEVHYLEGASVERHCSTRRQDRSNLETCTFSVDLATAEGVVSLSPFVASGGNEMHKYAFVEQVNAFVRDPGTPSLQAVETELGPQTGVLGLISLIGLAMVGVGVSRAVRERRGG